MSTPPTRTPEYGPDHYLVTHEVDAGAEGTRLDAFLKRRYRKRSREQIQRAIGEGVITVRREQGPHLTVGRLKPSSHLVSGDQVLVLSERKPEPEVSFDYRILHEDEDLLVIDKPGNLPVHPAGKYFFNTLLTHLRTHGHRTALPEGREYFLPHRIDKETSGVLCLTKDSGSCAHVTRQFAERETAKTYLAIVHGAPPDAGLIDRPVQRALNSRVELKMSTVVAGESGDLPEGAQTAQTEYRRLRTHGAFSLVECRPRTGRQHQIRVHLDSIGHPIVGDKLYGRSEEDAERFFERRWISPEAMAALILPRHALHAARLELAHPRTGRRLAFESPLPEDLATFLSRQT